MRLYQAKESWSEEPTSASPDAGGYACSFDIESVTPIYKGSARPDGIDPAYPFRGPALRGQLRAWWRATQRTTSVDALRAKEHHYFGGVFQHDEPRASRVALGLSGMSSRPAKRHELRSLTGGGYDYALWVDRGHDEGSEMYHVDARGRLDVSVRAVGGEGLDIDAGEFDRALKALILLGGSGSRSRRGMGRLWSKELFRRDSVANVAELQSMLDELAPPRGSRPWPSLAGARAAWLRDCVQSRPGQAVDKALESFKALRGMESLGGTRFDGSKRIPAAQNDWLRVRGGKPMDDAFTPALGMPLMYRSSNNHLSGVTKIEPLQGDRLPSPIHIRPVPTKGGWAPVIIALRPWYTGRIQAKNRAMGDQRGSLDPRAIDILLAEMAQRGWEIGQPRETA